MIVEMRARSQITIPQKITKDLGFKEGDMFEIVIRDGGVFLCPVVVYPKAKMDKITKILEEHEGSTSTVYDNVEDMFNELGIDNDV